MLDRELMRAMSDAAAEATAAAMAAGYGRSSKIVKDSAFDAAAAVYKRERPAEAPAPVYADHVPDPMKERIDRDFAVDPATGEVEF